MEILIVKESFVKFEALPKSVKTSASKIIRAIEVAKNIPTLKSVLPDDVVIIEAFGCNVLVKDNYQHVIACMSISIDALGRAVVTFKLYD